MGGGGQGSGSQNRRYYQLQVQGAQYNIAVPIVYGQVRMPSNVVWAGDLATIQNQTSGGKGGGQSQNTDTYTCSAIFALCRGPIAGVLRRWTDGAVHKSHPWSFLASNGWELFEGFQGQTVWSHLASVHPGAALSYSLTAYVCNTDIPMGGSPNLPQFQWEVAGLLQYGSGIVDAEPTAIISDILTDPTHGIGMNFPVSAAQLRSYCIASGTFISPLIDQQKTVGEWIRLILDTVHADGCWSEGELKLAPYYDQTITGNGITYTPQLAPVYNLTDNDICSSDKEPPIVVTRKNPQDRYNLWRVEYVNRSNDYKIEVVTAFSQGDIDAYTLKPAQTKQFHPITSPALAYNTAYLKLVQGLTVRNSYKFRLPQRFILLDPHIDIVSITRPELGLAEYPVRIVSIQEDEKTGELEIEAEDIGTNSNPGFSTQPPTGTILNDGGAQPPFVNTPAIFEPTSDMVGGVPQIWIGVSGQQTGQFDGSDWGGCHVWWSQDGSTYSQLGTIKQAATQGSLLANILAYTGTNPDTTHALQVDLSESPTAAYVALQSTSNALADAYNNLCWVDGEFMSFTTATTLTTPNHYTLSRLNRGLFGSTAGAHNDGAQFCFLNVLQNIDQAILQWEYPTRLIGQSIWLKFTSFNQYGDEEQDISSVQAFEYTVSGTAYNDPNGNGTLPSALGIGIAPDWTASTAEELGAIVIDSNGKGQQLVSIGGIEWNYNSNKSSHPGLALYDFAWPSAGTFLGVTQSLSASNAWVGQTVVLQQAAGKTIAVTGIGQGTDSLGVSVTIPTPPVMNVGDILIAQVVAHAGTTVSSAAGWTLIEGVANGSAIQSYLYYHVVSNPASEPATYAWTLGASCNNNGAMVGYSGVSGVSQSAQTTGTTAAPQAPGLTISGVAGWQILTLFAWGSTAQLTISGVTGASAPAWSTALGGITQDISLQWEGLGAMNPYNTWVTLATCAVNIASKKTKTVVAVDGSWAFSNFSPGDRVHWQILDGSTVIASGRVTLQVGTENSMEQFGTMFSRTISGYSGLLTLTAQIKVTNGSGSGQFTFAVDVANLTASPAVSRAVSGQ